MRFSKSLWVAAALAEFGAAAAHGAGIFERNQPSCKKCSCLSQVSYNYKAKADCSSFLRSTVTPCPATSTSTITTTLTAPTSTSTVTSTSIVTDSSTEDYVFYTSTTTVISSTTITFGSTTTETDVQTVTISAPPSVLKKRAAAPTCPHTSKASKIPSYACDCKSAAAYSSACACIGVKPTATTLPRSTNVVRSTLKTTVTPQTTSTFVSSSTVTMVVNTAIISTDSTYSTTTTISSTYVQTETVESTTTVLPSPTNCFLLQGDGGYVFEEISDGVNLSYNIETLYVTGFGLSNPGGSDGLLIAYDAEDNKVLVYAQPPPAAVDDGHWSTLHAVEGDQGGSPLNLLCTLDTGGALRCLADDNGVPLSTFIRCDNAGGFNGIGISDGEIPNGCHEISLSKFQDFNCY